MRERGKGREKMRVDPLVCIRSNTRREIKGIRVMNHELFFFRGFVFSATSTAKKQKCTNAPPLPSRQPPHPSFTSIIYSEGTADTT